MEHLKQPDKLAEEQKLIENIRTNLPELQKLLHRACGENGWTAICELFGIR